MHEEIISQLGKIRALKVTSRTSVMDYKGHAGDLRTVAEQLGVANILEGAVRRAGNRVRITTQLIDAETDEHLWSETYERDYSDVFAVESDVAHRVTAALRATLTPEERERVERKPTENLEAYDYYLTGREYLRRRGREYDQIGLEMLGKALELDPGFALVYATISVHYTGAYNPAQGRGQEYADSALAAARKAIELKPDLAEAHHALGRYYYSVLVDYDRAMEEFQIAIRLNPSDGSALFWVGVTQRRRGEWEEALANMRRAAELSPREYGIYPEYPATLTWMRRYEEAEPFYDRAIVLAPDRIFSYWFKAWGYLNQTGGIEESLRVWERLLAINPKASRANVQSFDARAGLRIWHDHVRQYARGPIRESVSNSSGYLLATAISYDLDGETELSHAYYDSTRVALEALLERAPDNPRYRSILGVSLAGMGRAEDAIREARRAVEVVPVSEDALSGPLYVATLAEVYAMVGEYDAAIDRLEYLLSITCPISPPLLQADPIWDPLRDHPRFQALLEEYE
jgi:tetratricopeptide (TPR) repeat protein